VAIQRTLDDGLRDKGRAVGVPLGLPPIETQAALQGDIFKELINKLAWVLGSTYRARYNTPTATARQAAIALARVVLKEHGYPSSIAREGSTSK